MAPWAGPSPQMETVALEVVGVEGVMVGMLVGLVTGWDLSAPVVLIGSPEH